jgi:hypothetical protein
MGISSLRVAALAVLLAAAGGCAAAAGRAPGAGASLDAMDSLFFEAGNWGRMTVAWRIYRDGSGEYRTTEAASPTDFHSYNIILRRFSAGPEGFGRVRALFAEAARLAARGISCRNYVTDVGSGRFGGFRGDLPGFEIRLEYGCSSRQLGRIADQVGQAGRLVDGWAAGQPVAEMREVRPPAARR